MSAKQIENIKVMIRVRPLNEKERTDNSKSCISINQGNQQQIIIDGKPEPKSFFFDNIASENTTQEEIFQIVGKQVTNSCVQGYNACVFAYGQTGTGKTYTMQGKNIEKYNNDQFHRGLMPRVFDYLYQQCSNLKDEENENKLDFTIKCSYFEIYNEQIIDLLAQSQQNLQVREDLTRGSYIENLQEISTTNCENTEELLRIGIKNRHVGCTAMNFESSRSHSVFSMNIESKSTLNNITKVKVSKLHFVDLAGSERQKINSLQNEYDKQILKEAGQINKSLTVLGIVINSLCENQSNSKSRHIAYRDSKLTFILKNSLGGNSKTFMITTISPSQSNYSESLSTLYFAQRAKMIKNSASINEQCQGNTQDLQTEIIRLREELQKLRIEQIKPENIVQFEQFSSCKPSDINDLQMQYLVKLNNEQMVNEGQMAEQVKSLEMAREMFKNEINLLKEKMKKYIKAIEVCMNNEIEFKTLIQIYQEKIKRINDGETQFDLIVKFKQKTFFILGNSRK